MDRSLAYLFLLLPTVWRTPGLARETVRSLSRTSAAIAVVYVTPYFTPLRFILRVKPY